MQNPARELATLLDTWRVVPPRTSIRSHREIDSSDLEGWNGQLRAAWLLNEVLRYISALEAAGRDVGHFQRAVPEWSAALFAPDYTWHSSQANEVAIAQSSTVDILRALADLIDVSGIAVSLNPEIKRSSLNALDEVTSLLGEANLTDATKQYVFELLTSCRRVISEATTLGRINLLSRVHELIGVLYMLADNLDDDPGMKQLSKNLRAAAKRVAPYVAFGAKVTAGSIGVAADIAQITS